MITSVWTSAVICFFVVIGMCCKAIENEIKDRKDKKK
jgi:hypothetical protein